MSKPEANLLDLTAGEKKKLRANKIKVKGDPSFHIHTSASTRHRQAEGDGIVCIIRISKSAFHWDSLRSGSDLYGILFSE